MKRLGDTERSPWHEHVTPLIVNMLSLLKKEQGFHNYALPYSWDVRVGHKTRTEALDELDDDIDVDRVSTILSEVGYAPRDDRDGPQGKRLVAAQSRPDTCVLDFAPQA